MCRGADQACAQLGARLETPGGGSALQPGQRFGLVLRTKKVTSIGASWIRTGASRSLYQARPRKVSLVLQ